MAIVTAVCLAVPELGSKALYRIVLMHHCSFERQLGLRRPLGLMIASYQIVT
jgi:hypothetical protein